MTTQYLHTNFVFSIEDFAHTMAIWQAQNNLTDKECNELSGCISAWNSIKNMSGEYSPDKLGRVSMGLFLSICNVMDCDPRQFFKLDRSLE